MAQQQLAPQNNKNKAKLRIRIRNIQYGSHSITHFMRAH